VTGQHDHAARAADHKQGLRAGCLSLIENIAQTLGVLTPSGTISVIIPLLILSAGNGTWLLLLITLSIFLVIMLCVTRFASLHASAGSLSSYSALGFGRTGGLVGGWIYLLGISFCVPSALLASASYFDFVLASWLLVSHPLLRLEIITALVTSAAWVAAHRDIKFSTNLMLVIECASLAIMSVLVIGAMHFFSAWVDPAQLHLQGVKFSGLQGGLVLAFMLMAGFESTTSLGEEAVNPKQAIPRAIASCMLPLTLLYLVVSYCLVSLQNRGVIVPQDNGLTVPLDSMARALGWRWLGPISSLGVALSYFACGLASLTAASRVLFSMARERQFYSSYGETHPRNATPHRAIALISVISVIIPVVMLAAGAQLTVSINALSQLGSLGLIGGYLMVAIALPLYLRRQELLKRGDLVVAATAAIMLLIVIVLTVYPQPPPPFDYLPYIFVAMVLAGIGLSVLRSSLGGRSPTRPQPRSDRDEIAQIEHD
jgi:amino acid transporter